ncbi:MAG: CdaR family protein [Cellulosilyticaceae bacterium]
MNRFFSHNLPWKLVSLALASMLWLFVINTQNPLQPKEIKEVSINIRGINEIESKGYVVQNEESLRNTKVKLIVKGPRLELEKLESKKNEMITVNLDLAPFASTLTTGSDTIERPVEYTVTTLGENVRVEEIRPKTTYVTFEKEKSITLPVQNTVAGDNNSQYMALDPIIKPSQVEIKGPKTLVESIKKLVVEINIDDFSEDVLSYTLPIKALDGEGNEVLGVRKSPQYIEVTLPIGKKKTVPLEAQFQGTLPSGYIQSNTIITPKQITIVGKSALVDSIQTIKLGKISLDNMIASNTMKVDFLLPDGIEYIDNIENKAVVTVEIQKENTYEFDIPIENLNLNVQGLASDMYYELLDTELKVVLGGTAENLLKFDKNNINATIALSGLKPGEYSIPVQINTPNNLKIINTPLTLGIQIKEKEAPQPPQPPVEEEVLPEEEPPAEENPELEVPIE